MFEPPLHPVGDAPQHGPRPLPLFLELLREQTAASPERFAAAMRGLRAYQNAPRGRERRRAPVAARAGRASLRDYGRQQDGLPVVFVPSLINPSQVLDLRGRSLMRWLARHKGLRPMLVDWGEPVAAVPQQDIDAHVTDLLLPLIDTLDRPPVLVGYCLGGTLAMAAAALRPLAGLALIAAPWRFAGFGEAALGEIEALWRASEPLCGTLGLVPMEVLQSGFWRLDPARTVRKFEKFGMLEPRSRAARGFVALEDWANGGAPLTYAAGRQMFEDFFTADLPGTGRWRIGGTAIDPLALGIPRIEFLSTTDRIVPAASAVGFADQRRTSAGHVGMVVGGGAREILWLPLRDWIRGRVLPR